MNLERWPKPDPALVDATLEEEFEVLLKCLPLVYSARQSARLKRRWPINKAVVVASERTQRALKNLEELFLELANVKKVEYVEKIPEVELNRWALASDFELHVFLDTQRDETLEGEGLMRDLARRVQALRKELGFMPTDILNAVHVAELGSNSVKLLEPHLIEMAELVRAKKVYVQEKRAEVKAEWHECDLDHKKIYVAIS